MSKEVFEEKDVKSSKVALDSDIAESNNTNEESKRLLKYDKYKDFFDITISNDTVIFKVKYQ